MQRVDIYNRAMEFFFPPSPSPPFFLKISKIRSNLIHPRTTTALIEFPGGKFYLYETREREKKELLEQFSVSISLNSIFQHDIS